MKRFKVIKDGKETNTWTSDFAGADYREPSFGDEGTFQIIEEDMQAETDAKAQRIIALKSQLDQLKNFDIGGATTAQLKQYLIGQRAVMMKLLKILDKALENNE